MNILFLTKSKEFTLKFLKKIIDDGHNVWVVCKDYSSFSGSKMESYCLENNIRFVDNKDLYEELNNHQLPEFDFAISNTYGRLIRKELIDRVKGNIINLHGAVLPAYKGAFTYNWGLFNLEKEWGATAHFVNERFDEGDIIQIKKFPIDPETITVAELERKTQEAAYELTVELLDKFINGVAFERTPQTGDGKYYRREDFENLKRITTSDSAEIVNRKIHSCWCPPYEGAFIEIDGNRYSIINSGLMEKLLNG